MRPGDDLRLAKIMAFAGAALLAAAIALLIILPTLEVWVTRSSVLIDYIVTIEGGDEHSLYPSLFLPVNNVRNINLKGYLREINGKKFDFYILNSKLYVKAINVSEYKFDIRVSLEELYDLKLQIVNIRTNRVRVVEDLQFGFHPDAQIRLKPSFTMTSISTRPFFFGVCDVPVTISGEAWEASGYRFNFYVLDELNIHRLFLGDAFEAYYAGKGASSYRFTFTLPAEKCDSFIYFVVERTRIMHEEPELIVFLDVKKIYEKPEAIEVEYRVEASWEEKSYDYALAGSVIGGILIGFGVFLIAAALTLKMVNS